MVHNYQYSLISSHKSDGVNGDIARNHPKGTIKLFGYTLTLECVDNSNEG